MSQNNNNMKLYVTKEKLEKVMRAAEGNEHNSSPNPRPHDKSSSSITTQYGHRVGNGFSPGDKNSGGCGFYEFSYYGAFYDCWKALDEIRKPD